MKKEEVMTFSHEGFIRTINGEFSMDELTFMLKFYVGFKFCDSFGVISNIISAIENNLFRLDGCENLKQVAIDALNNLNRQLVPIADDWGRNMA